MLDSGMSVEVCISSLSDTVGSTSSKHNSALYIIRQAKKKNIPSFPAFMSPFLMLVV